MTPTEYAVVLVYATSHTMGVEELSRDGGWHHSVRC
jgi:hypothetical protein